MWRSLSQTKSSGRRARASGHQGPGNVRFAGLSSVHQSQKHDCYAIPTLLRLPPPHSKEQISRRYAWDGHPIETRSLICGSQGVPYKQGFQARRHAQGALLHDVQIPENKSHIAHRSLNLLQEYNFEHKQVLSKHIKRSISRMLWYIVVPQAHSVTALFIQHTFYIASNNTFLQSSNTVPDDELGCNIDPRQSTQMAVVYQP